MMENKESVEPAVLAGPRTKTQLRVYYGANTKTALSGFSIDLSPGGLFLKTDNQFKVDDNLILNFILSDSKKLISCKARVAWTNQQRNRIKESLPPGIGVQFVDITPEDLESLDKFIDENELEPDW